MGLSRKLRAEHKPKPGRQLTLKRGRASIIRPLGPTCELTIVPEFVDGKMGIRVWGPDGVEIEHFQVSDCPKSLQENDTAGRSSERQNV